MTELVVDVWSDFVCPWCYLASTSLERLAQEQGMSVIWHSYELRPKGAPPTPEWYVKKIENELRPQMENMAKQHYGLTINSGKFGIDSRPALIGAKFAEEHHKGHDYHKATFEAYWLHAKDISDLNILADIAVSVGLDREAFLVALNNKDYEVLVDTDILQAQQLNLSGVPAMIFQRKYLIPGAQPYEELVRSLAQIKQREGMA
jgi:predicted DsbA family dithiol-disulfide isomerase